MVQTETEKTQAVLIDIAEIGAALSSGDMELGQVIVSLRNPSSSVEQALLELLEGGALMDLSDRHYAEAFLLLCQELGETLPSTSTVTVAGVGDPFDIPTDAAGQIGVISPEDATEFLAVYDGADNPESNHLHSWCRRAVADNLSVAMFTHIGFATIEPCTHNSELVLSGV